MNELFNEIYKGVTSYINWHGEGAIDFNEIMEYLGTLSYFDDLLVQYPIDEIMNTVGDAIVLYLGNDISSPEYDPEPFFDSFPEQLRNQIPGWEEPYGSELRNQGSILDREHNKLDPKIFNKSEVVKPSIVKFIENKVFQIFKDYFGFDVDEYIDLYLTGSLCTFNYSPTSDFDLSIFIQYDMWPSRPHIHELRWAIVNLIVDKLDGIYIPGSRHPIQTFVQPPRLTPGDVFIPGERAGWSFYARDWIVPPLRHRHINIKEELPSLYSRAYQIAEKMESLLTSNPEQAKRLYKRLHKKRKEETSEYGKGDYSEANITYKMLDHMGMFDRLRGLGVRIATKFDLRNKYAPQTGTIVFEFDGSIVNWKNPEWEGYGITVEGDDGYMYHLSGGMVQIFVDDGGKEVGDWVELDSAYSPEMQKIEYEDYMSENTITQRKKIPGEYRRPIPGQQRLIVPGEDPYEHFGSSPESTLVLYDNDNGIITLGINEKDADNSSSQILGEYVDNNVLLYPNHDQWISGDYFKKLWAHTFEDKPLKEIYVVDDGEVTHYPTKPYRKKRTIKSDYKDYPDYDEIRQKRWYETTDSRREEPRQIIAEELRNADNYLEQNYQSMTDKDFTNFLWKTVVPPILEKFKSLPVNWSIDPTWATDLYQKEDPRRHKDYNQLSLVNTDQNEWYRKMDADQLLESTDDLWEFVDFWRKRIAWESGPHLSRTSSWKDVMEKAKRYRDEGNTKIEVNSWIKDPVSGVLENYVKSTTNGDTGTWETEIWRDDPSSNAVSRWSCDCPWGSVSWGRTRQWKRYQGRPCSHALATQWMSWGGQYQPTEEQPPGQPTAPAEQPQQQQEQSSPNIPGAINQPEQESLPQSPSPTVTEAPQTPLIQSQPILPGQAPMGMGGFSHIKTSGVFSNGDYIRVKMDTQLMGEDRDGNWHTIGPNTAGQVLYCDDKDCVVIFPLRSSTQLQPHLVRVETTPDTIERAPSNVRPFTSGRSKPNRNQMDLDDALPRVNQGRGWGDPIGYTYEADYHCPNCTARRFGIDEGGWIPENSTDSEGNPIGAIFSTDNLAGEIALDIGDNSYVVYCSDCQDIIDSYEDPYV